MTTPAKQELRDLIAENEGKRRNGPASDGRGWYRNEADQAECYAIADAVVALFHEVADEWESIDVSTMADGPGGKLLDQRWLVARIPREARHRDMTADRTVTP